MRENVIMMLFVNKKRFGNNNSVINLNILNRNVRNLNYKLPWHLPPTHLHFYQINKSKPFLLFYQFT